MTNGDHKENPEQVLLYFPLVMFGTAFLLWSFKYLHLQVEKTERGRAMQLVIQDKLPNSMVCDIRLPQAKHDEISLMFSTLGFCLACDLHA